MVEFELVDATGVEIGAGYKERDGREMEMKGQRLGWVDRGSVAFLLSFSPSTSRVLCLRS